MPCRGSRRESRATRFCARPRILERVRSSPGRSACGTGICRRRRASMVVLLRLRAELAAERGEILAQAFHRVTGGGAAKQQQQHACAQQAASQGMHHRGPLDRHGVDPAAPCAREVNAARRPAGRLERKPIGTGRTQGPPKAHTATAPQTSAIAHCRLTSHGRSTRCCTRFSATALLQTFAYSFLFSAILAQAREGASCPKGRNRLACQRSVSLARPEGRRAAGRSATDRGWCCTA
jgi:hypothetical protein